MKQKKFLIIGSFMLMVAAAGGYHAYTSNLPAEKDMLFMSNIEALATSAESPSEVVKCYCKTNWFSPNICSASASGSYCGGDPCSNHDGNCR